MDWQFHLHHLEVSRMENTPAWIAYNAKEDIDGRPECMWGKRKLEMLLAGQINRTVPWAVPESSGIPYDGRPEKAVSVGDPIVDALVARAMDDLTNARLR